MGTTLRALINGAIKLNIFVLDNQIQTSVEMHNDKHVVKMCTEYAQLLCTAHRLIDGEFYYGRTQAGRRIQRWRLKEYEDVLYKACHHNHPSAIWTRENNKNYQYMYTLWKKLCEEYTYRYGKVHATWTKLSHVLNKAPKNIKIAARLAPLPQCMPDECKRVSVVEGYREYYRQHKKSFSVYTKRDTPKFLEAQ